MKAKENSSRTIRNNQPDTGAVVAALKKQEIDTFHGSGGASVIRSSAVDGVLGHLAQGASVRMRGKFFSLLALHIAASLRIHYVLIGEFVENDPGRIHTLGFVADQKIRKNITYGLSGTPCQRVYQRGKVCVYRSGLQKRFPRDVLLRQMRAESYMGIPLIDSKGKIIGLIAAIGREILQDPTDGLWLLRIAAARVAGEVETRIEERDLNATQVRLSILARQLVRNQENEHREITGKLHDEIGQEIPLLQLKLLELRAACKTKTEKAAHKEALAVTEGIRKRVEKLTLSLHPPVLEDLGLQAAVRWYLRTQAKRLSIVGRVICRPWRRRPKREIEVACYRIVQESLSNAARHARAKKVVVRLKKQRKALTVEFRDDGTGFDFSRVSKRARRLGKVGLLILDERVRIAGGRLRIVSGKGKGTEIRARFPNAFR